MIIHWDQLNTTIYVLLDTGCTTPLINNSFIDKWNIPCLKHEHGIAIRNFSGDIVQRAGDRYTKPMLLQHGSTTHRKSSKWLPWNLV
jgi:hypothetical protein